MDAVLIFATSRSRQPCDRMSVALKKSLNLHHAHRDPAVFRLFGFSWETTSMKNALHAVVHPPPSKSQAYIAHPHRYISMLTPQPAFMTLEICDLFLQTRSETQVVIA